MIEAICFEKEHRYLPKELDGYMCQNCNKIISIKEFHERSNSSTWINGKPPLGLCTICDTWHVPYHFDINSRIETTLKGREIVMIDMKNGRYFFETNIDESGYVSASSWCDAILNIRQILNRSN